MRSKGFLGLAAVAVVAFLAAPAAAQDADVMITIEAREICDGDQALCLVVTEGDLESVAPGDQVEVTYRNTGNLSHNLYVIESENADAGHSDTSSDEAVAGTDGMVAPGDEATVTFTAPEEADGLYYWCDVTGHEEQGMWLEAEYAMGANETDDEGDPFGGDESPTSPEGPTPSISVVFALAAVAAAFVALRRRAA